jgi:SWIM zinc finger
MEERWDATRVEALAPDAAVAAAGRALAAGSGWSGVGATTTAVWGLVAGSGARPYRAAVDLTGPAFSCSCPSRKIPCKHAVGLLLRWATGRVQDAAEPAPFAAEWLAERAGRADRAPQRRVTGEVADPEAAQRRAERREASVSAGLAELDRRLADQIRTGLAAPGRAAQLAQVAARMVDAQAPGVASWLRRLHGVPAGTSSEAGARLLEQYALLHLLVTAHARLDALDGELAATVRGLVGYPVSTASVLAGPAVPDTWLALAVTRSQEEHLQVQRTWLRGARTGRWALLLAFAPAAGVLEQPVAPGAAIDADLHFHPGAVPLRAQLGERRADAVPPPEPDPAGVAGVLADHAAALAADPWTRSVPTLLGPVHVCCPADAAAGGEGWAVVDAGGLALPLAPAAVPAWGLLAASCGAPVTVFGTWSPDGLVPLSVRAADGPGWWAA